MQVFPDKEAYKLVGDDLDIYTKAYKKYAKSAYDILHPINTNNTNDMEALYAELDTNL